MLILGFQAHPNSLFKCKTMQYDIPYKLFLESGIKEATYSAT